MKVKSCILLFLLPYVLFSQDSLQFTKRDLKDIHLLKLDTLYQNHQEFNDQLKEILQLERKRNDVNVAGKIFLGIGLVTTIAGIAGYEDKPSANDDLSTGIGKGVAHELSVLSIKTGLILSAVSIPFLIDAKGKRIKRDKKIENLKNYF